MTDPVDTDALRTQQWQNVDELVDWAIAAADEVDRLRAAESRAYADRAQALVSLGTQIQANARLRAVIENAPHGRYCALTFRPKPKHTANRCTCWKADAL